VDPLAEINRQTVPQIERVLDEAVADMNSHLAANIDRAVGQISNVVQGALVGVLATADKASVGLVALMAAQDGWTGADRGVLGS
jgi:hypothetical protein